MTEAGLLPDMLVPDVLVVGGGVAGVLAAARAREQGAKVVLLRRAGGATSLSSGAIDVADELVGLVPGPAFDPFERGGRWRKAADIVAGRQPRHPYARLGNAGRDRLRPALSLLKQLASAVDLVERDDGANHVVATQLGTVKRAAFVQKCQLLDLASFDPDAVIGVVEPQDLAGFTARSVVHMMSWIAGLGGRRLQLTPIIVERTLPGTEIYASASEMAAALDDDNMRAAFAEALKASLRRFTRVPSALLVPPILGAGRSSIVTADLDRAAGRPVRELLALPPSRPGDRLERALLASVARMGVNVVDAAATKGTTHGRRAHSVVVEGRGFRAELKPRAVVLASGRFFSGGICRDGVARETLFDLPVTTGGALIGDSFIADHLGELPDSPHALFRAGVAVDESLRPVDLGGRVILDNVACAGSVVEGWDPARDGTGAAVSALTGFIAGERAALMAKAER